MRTGATTSRALTEAAIDVADRLDEQVGTYQHRFDDLALAAADRADAELAAGQDRGPLHGTPFGVKDIIAMAEGPTTAQSLVLDTWGAGKDAPVVARLKAAGAVITGKTTTMDFACGMPDPGKLFPIPRNPWDVETWPGGSSSGTGSGVAAGMFLAGLGTDTAGSIRRHRSSPAGTGALRGRVITRTEYHRFEPGRGRGDVLDVGEPGLVALVSPSRPMPPYSRPTRSCPGRGG